MFFLLRTAFWFSLLLLILPFGGDKGDGPSARERASIDALSAVAAAGATISDVSGFCSRQPDACSVGGQALKLVGERAREGATALSGYFSSGTEAPKNPADLKTGAVAQPRVQPATVAVPTAAPGRQTLTSGDRKPGWRGPDA